MTEETPSLEQITAELSLLRERSATLPKLNAVGDDNHAAIQGQITVLERPAEITEDVIERLLDTLPFYTTDAMLRARQWLDSTYELPVGGTYETALSDEWVPAKEPEA